MDNIVDITKRLKGCDNCKWHDVDMGACTRPGGYRMDIKLGVCVDFVRKAAQAGEGEHNA